MTDTHTFKQSIYSPTARTPTPTCTHLFTCSQIPRSQHDHRPVRTLPPHLHYLPVPRHASHLLVLQKQSPTYHALRWSLTSCFRRLTAGLPVPVFCCKNTGFEVWISLLLVQRRTAVLFSLLRS